MADKITTEFLTLDDVLGGDVYFGLAESYQIRYLAAAIREFKESYPDLHYHITSGDTEQVTEKMDKGIIDFAVLVKKDTICVDDLIGLPLFCSEQGWNNDISKWCGNNMDKLHLEGSFRLSYNGSLFVKKGLGYLLTFEHLINTNPGSGLACDLLYFLLFCFYICHIFNPFSAIKRQSDLTVFLTEN